MRRPKLKQEHAFYFWRRMQVALEPPPRTQMNVAQIAARAIISTGWQRSVYANFDAFLAMARSVPEIIQACFGADTGSGPMRTWFQGLPIAEQQRRADFSAQFDPTYPTFRQLPLSNKRNITFHRTGVVVRINGRFGVYTESATES